MIPISSNDNKTLNIALTQLRSGNVLVQNEGVEAVIHIGKAVVPALLPLLKEEAAGVRAQVMYALSQIAEPTTAEVFEQGLQDLDERVRANAAEGLVRINHPSALTACLRTLNDAPDPLHLDMTPSVQALGQIGMPAVPALLDLLMNEDEFTRLHAQRALEIILARRYGFQPGRGFPTPKARGQMHAEWQANGNYNYTDDVHARAAQVAKLRQWFATMKE